MRLLAVVVRLADGLSEFTGRLAAWIFFAIGICITYEVVMRYVFVSPTVWVDEVARIGQIWAAYLSAAFVLKHRELIVIDVAFRTPGTLARRLAETFGLVVIATVCFVAVRYGLELWFRATVRGHTTDTYLALPKWFTEASVWVGFSILGFQVLAELVRLWMPQRTVR